MVSWAVESDTLSMNFSSSINIKIYWSVFHFEWIFYPGILCIGHLKTESLNYVDLSNPDTFHYIRANMTFVNITTNLMINVFNYQEAARSTMTITSFPKF